ncbi:MAG TPA: carboxypeptidase-like regulatory domain-containing protein [Kofleriaceae bacterium]
MTRRTRFLQSRGGFGVVIAGLLAWWLFGHGRAPRDAQAQDPAQVRAQDRASTAGLGDQLARARAARIPFAEPPAHGDEVEVSGRVVDMASAEPVPDTEVVLLSASGEASAITDRAGHYTIQVPPGMYRAYVRSDRVMSVGRRPLERIPGEAVASAVEAPDETAMAVVLATSNVEHVDLPVVRAGVIAGVVVDSHHAPIAGAVVSAYWMTQLRPVLGTDIAEAGPDGRFELRVPAGIEILTASHPRFVASPVSAPRLTVPPGGRVEATLEMRGGCIVTGKVVRADGRPAGDGAIEQQWGHTDNSFSPSGQIAADGTFRWVGVTDGPVELRAWPWKSPPSASQQLACRDGARFAGVVFRIPDEAPALSGTLRDAAGQPMPLVYMHLAPVDAGAEVASQQERSDAAGNFAFYHVPPGRYQVSAVSERGVVKTELQAPQAGVTLTLSGTGSIRGKAKIPDGTMLVQLLACDEVADAGTLSDTRLAWVHDGAFQLDQVPACQLRLMLSYDGRQLVQSIGVDRDGLTTFILREGALLTGPRGPTEPEEDDGFGHNVPDGAPDADDESGEPNEATEGDVLGPDKLAPANDHE